jgi:hypothetical protein
VRKWSTRSSDSRIEPIYRTSKSTLTAPPISTREIIFFTTVITLQLVKSLEQSFVVKIAQG